MPVHCTCMYHHKKALVLGHFCSAPPSAVRS